MTISSFPIIYIQEGLSTTVESSVEKGIEKYLQKKEVLNWSNLTWQGKSTPYSPFVDCGGFRCRHRLMPISKEMYDRYKNRLIP